MVKVLVFNQNSHLQTLQYQKKSWLEALFYFWTILDF